MKRYCVLENLRTENNYKWEDLQTDNFWDIYIQILKKYYFPKSIQEIFRLINGKDNYTEFWQLMPFECEKIWSAVSNAITDMTQIIVSEKEAIDSKAYNAMQGWRFKATPDIMQARNDNVYEDILRDIICKRAKYFYLDICLGIYYSLIYYTERADFVPFIDMKSHREDEAELTSGWNKFLRKCEDKRRREEKQKDKKKISYTKLSEFGVELPIDTAISYSSKELFLSAVGADVFRFFIRIKDKETDGRRSSDILDLFSTKRMTRFTIANYDRFKMEELLAKFKTYNEKDDLINQFLLEQCFEIDICENICDFLETIFPSDKLTNVDIKDTVVHYIDLFVHELQQCIPNFSKLLILEETKNLLFLSPENRVNASGYLQQGCSRVKLASDIVRLLTLEINYEYKELCNVFYNAIFEKCNKNLDQVRDCLEKEIINSKTELHIKRNKIYEYMNVRVFKNTARKKHDEIYPYVQKALMIMR